MPLRVAAALTRARGVCTSAENCATPKDAVIPAAELLSRFPSVPADEPYDLAVLQQNLLRTDQLAAYEVFDRFHEIGSLTGLEETRRYLAGAKVNPAKSEG